MSESSKDKKDRLRKAVIIRHRRNKNLCDRCGRSIHSGNCIEDYTVTDMRSIPQEPKTLDLKRKKDTILAYRKKKLLCERCGNEKHIGECEEDYEKSDNRSDHEKIIRPATILTPKKKNPSILEQLETTKDIEPSMNPRVQITLHHDFIILNLIKSDYDDMIEYSCVNQLSRKFKDHIICVIGNIDKCFPYSDVMKIKRLSNIREIRPCYDQVIVDHICSSKKLFTFHNELYSQLCMKYNIPIFEFVNGKNATNFLPDEAYRI